MPSNNESKYDVAIIGAGPSGCALACFLAQRGIQCIVFDDDKRPDLLVGESLLPAVVPILRKLGIEDRVRKFSVEKPGASFFHACGTRVDLKFKKRGKNEPGYSYNVPRPEFDNLLRDRAIELGVSFVNHRAKIQPSDHPDRDVELYSFTLSKFSIFRSSGSVISFSTSDGAAPGHTEITVAMGISICGVSSRGMFR